MRREARGVEGWKVARGRLHVESCTWKVARGRLHVEGCTLYAEGDESGISSATAGGAGAQRRTRSDSSVFSFIKKPRIATDHTDEHGCLYSFVPIRHIRTDPGALWDVTSLQKRTAETPRAQRTQKRTVTDAWRSVRGHDALWNLSLRTLRLCGDIPFLQWTHI